MPKPTNRSKTSRKSPAKRTVRRVGDFEKGFYIAAISFAVALTTLLAHGASYGASTLPWSAIGLEHRAAYAQPQIHSHNAVYGRAMFLNAKYDSRPYWRGSKLVIGAPTDQATADLAIEHLIPCESGGRTIDRLDTNGKMSYGILQFQDWPEWERVSGIKGDPDNRDDAIRMAEWGIEHGRIDHWTCARILGED
jgi:hypothetical protein